MDEETAKKLCSVIVDRLARNKVWGFPSLQYPGGKKRDRLKLEAERLVFVDCQTIDIQELQKILQSYDEKKGLLSVEYFRERVLLYPDERGEKKARAYEPGKVGSLYPGVQLGQDQASRDFLRYLLSPPDQMFRSVAPYFKEGDTRAKEVAQKIREVADMALRDYQPGTDVEFQPKGTSKTIDITRFPSAKDLVWEEVSMAFLSDEAIKVKAGGTVKEYRFDQIGFKDNRNGKPTSLWLVLRGLAATKGRASWEDLKERGAPDLGDRNKLQAKVKGLRKILRDFMGIEDDPFQPYREVNAYQTRFTIIADARALLDSEDDAPSTDVQDVYQEEIDRHR